MKNSSKFFIYQIILFSLFFGFNSVLDLYISKPFTWVDFAAICISLLWAVLIFITADKLYEKLDAIRLRNKVFLSIPALILAIFLIVLLNELFSW